MASPQEMHAGPSPVPHTQPATGSAEPSHSGPKSILHLLSHIMRSHVDKRAIRLTFSRWWEDVGEETQAAKSVKQLLENSRDGGIVDDRRRNKARQESFGEKARVGGHERTS